LCAMHPLRCARKAFLLRHGDQDFELVNIHSETPA
jgi:hypothetical protein